MNICLPAAESGGQAERLDAGAPLGKPPPMHFPLRLAFLAAAASLSLGAAPPAADLLIRGGTIYPGGGAPFVGDVAVRGDRILAIGPHLRLSARRVIDAGGMIVAPGFIDPHTHME